MGVAVMRFYSCWLLADADEAPAIHTIVTTKERQLAEWPHLILKDVDGDDVNKLERMLRPKEKGRRGTVGVGGKLLAKSKFTATPFTCVCLVNADFVQRLAALDEPA